MLGKYCDQIFTGSLPYEKEELDSNQKFNEYVMVSLRTKWGIDLNDVKREFGFSICQEP